jgi:hypothetical protein
LIIIAGTFLAVLFLLNFFKDWKRIQIIENENKIIPKDIIEPIHKRTYFVDELSLVDGSVRIESYTELKNMMKNQVYNEFKIERSSSQDITDFRSIRIKINNHECDKNFLNHISPDITICTDPSADQIKRKKLSFNIPLDLKSDESCILELFERNKSLKPAIDGSCDYVGFKCRRYIGKIIFEINLDEKIKGFYKLSMCYERENNAKLWFKVLDESNQRMWFAEAEFEKAQKPVYLDDKIIWRIDNPKVGYEYRLYFSLIRSDVPATTVQPPT